MTELAPDRSARWEQLAAATGIVYVVAVVATLFVIGEIPDDQTGEQLTALMEDRGARVSWIPGYLAGFSAVFLIWFAGSLRSTLRRAEGGTGRLSAVAFGGAIASAILWAAAFAAFIAIPFAVQDEKGFVVDANMHRVIENVGYGFFIYSVMAGGVMVGASSMVALRTGVFATWFAILGAVIATVLVAIAGAFFPLFALLLWVLIASVLLINRARRMPAG